jgi:hypothetical protein
MHALVLTLYLAAVPVPKEEDRPTIAWPIVTLSVGGAAVVYGLGAFFAEGFAHWFGTELITAATWGAAGGDPSWHPSYAGLYVALGGAMIAAIGFGWLRKNMIERSALDGE